MKTTLTILILLTVFSLNTIAQDIPYTSVVNWSGSIWLSPDFQILAHDVKSSNIIHLTDVTTKKKHKHTLSWTTESTRNREGVRNIAFSPDGLTLASYSWDRTIRLWDVATGTINHTLTEHTDYVVRNIAFSPDGQTLLSRSDTTIRLWDVATGEVKHTLTGHTDDVNSVVFSPDGQTLASGSDDTTIRLWDVATGEVKHTLTEHTDDVNSVVFSSDGLLASVSDDNTIRLWDVETGTLNHTFFENRYFDRSVVFSPDGQILAGVSSPVEGFDTIYLWDTETGTRKAEVQERLWAVTSVAFSPDGNIFASGGYEGKIHLFDPETGMLIVILAGHNGDYVDSVAFSPDGQTLASESYHSRLNSGTTLLWEIPDTRVNMTVLPVDAPAIGDRLMLNIGITESENVAGYQARVLFDETALRYVKSSNGDYLPDNSFFVDPVVEGNQVLLGATSRIGDSSGDGTLTTLTFEFIAIKESTLTLSETVIVDSVGKRLPFLFENRAPVVGVPRLREDVNLDGIVDILDLTLVAASFGELAKKRDPSYIPGGYQ